MEDLNETRLFGNRDFDEQERDHDSDEVGLVEAAADEEEPVEIIVARVVFALLISVSIVMNLLLVLAVIRRWRTVHLIYVLAASMILPDLIFYSKLVAELVNSWGTKVPSWATSDWACGLWQFSTHIPPLLYASLLLAIVYHAFVTLFLDYSGGYEESAKRMFPLLLAGILTLCSLMSAPSGLFARTRPDNVRTEHKHCDLKVPSILIADDKMSPDMFTESEAAYRLVYELVLPFIMPLLLMAFPYVSLLIGLMRSVPAASHSEHSTKITVVVTLWLVTSYLMLHVPTILRNVFSVFNVWHRLMTLFDAHDDERVPKFQSYIHMMAYILTCIWAIVRASMCFKYNHKLRKALGP